MLDCDQCGTHLKTIFEDESFVYTDSDGVEYNFCSTDCLVKWLMENEIVKKVVF